MSSMHSMMSNALTKHIRFITPDSKPRNGEGPRSSASTTPTLLGCACSDYCSLFCAQISATRSAPYPFATPCAYLSMQAPPHTKHFTQMRRSSTPEATHMICSIVIDICICVDVHILMYMYVHVNISCVYVYVEYFSLCTLSSNA